MYIGRTIKTTAKKSAAHERKPVERQEFQESNKRKEKKKQNINKMKTIESERKYPKETKTNKK